MCDYHLHLIYMNARFTCLVSIYFFSFNFIPPSQAHLQERIAALTDIPAAQQLLLVSHKPLRDVVPYEDQKIRPEILHFSV